MQNTEAARSRSFPETKPFISTRPSAFRSTSWSMPHAMPVCNLITRALREPAPKSNPAPAPHWKGGSQKSASPAFRDLPKTDFQGYKQPNSTTRSSRHRERRRRCARRKGWRRGRSRPRPHQLLRRLRRPDRRHRLVYLDRRQHHRCRNHRLRSPVQGVRAHKAILKQDSPSATTSTLSSTATAATPSAAITPARTCCTRP